MQRRSLLENREVSGPTDPVVTERSALGRRGAEADDARAGEVRPFHSGCEAGEQDRTKSRGFSFLEKPFPSGNIAGGGDDEPFEALGQWR
jgi:hypothetical protein